MYTLRTFSRESAVIHIKNIYQGVFVHIKNIQQGVSCYTHKEHSAESQVFVHRENIQQGVSCLYTYRTFSRETAVYIPEEH